MKLRLVDHASGPKTQVKQGTQTRPRPPSGPERRGPLGDTSRPAGSQGVVEVWAVSRQNGKPRILHSRFFVVGSHPCFCLFEGCVCVCCGLLFQLEIRPGTVFPSSSTHVLGLLFWHRPKLRTHHLQDQERLPVVIVMNPLEDFNSRY